MLTTKAYAAASASSPLAPLQIERRAPGVHEVLIDILYCGVCHTDISYARGHFPNPVFPLVPGHEIIGKVVQTGDAVSGHQVGDTVGVGCIVNSCRSCPECSTGHEQFCDALRPTYGGFEEDGKTPTFGGYSTRITVDGRYVLKIPPGLAPAAAAPLLCAGITTYSPLRHWNVGKGSKVAVVGLGGLGHLAVKLAVAMGAEVTVLSRSDRKKADALQLGASDFAVTGNPENLAGFRGRFNLILNTVSASTDCDLYLSLLGRDGTLVLVGVPEGPLSINPFGLLMKRKSVAMSIVGGIRETQEMLEFCGEHNIQSDIEMIGIGQINDAYERILKSDVRYRFVIDMASLR